VTACGLLVAVLFASYLLAGRLGGTAAVQMPAQGDVGALLSRIAPQGWAFFTKPARSATPTAHAHDGGRWVQVAGVSNAQLRFLGGLSREGRRQGVEMASVLTGIPRRAWLECDGRDLPQCVSGQRRQSVLNPLPHPTLCGNVVLAATKPTPWEWRYISSEGTYVSEAIALEVRCRHA
jgi:antimicrobial peptide system SdpA family protein